MAYQYSSSFYRRKARRDTDGLQRILNDWYGKNIASNEIINYLPKPELIKDGVDKALKRLVNADTAFLQMIKREWNAITGEQLAKYTTPSSFYKGVLYIEVSHPAWLMQLGKSEQKLLLEKIQTHTKKKTCLTLRFIPFGKNKYS